MSWMSIFDMIVLHTFTSGKQGYTTYTISLQCSLSGHLEGKIEIVEQEFSYSR